MKLLIEKYYWIFLGLILAFAFATRVYQVGKIQSYIFDEVYHAVTAKLISQNDPRAYEWWNEPPEPNTAVDWLHPPLAKYTQAAGMLVFGETPFGWRISSVIFGTLVILATALLAEELFTDKRISLLAAGIAAMDGLLLVQSRIAMNDIHVTFFILLTLFAYAKYRKSGSKLFLLFLTGLFAGLATASKWSGIFGLGTVIFFEGISLLQTLYQYIFTYRNKKFLKNHIRGTTFSSSIKSILEVAGTQEVLTSNLKTVVTQIGKILIFLVFLPAFIYVFGYLHMFLQGKSLVCEEDFAQQGSCYCEQTNSWWVEDLKKIMPSRSAEWEAIEARGGCKRLISHFSELHKEIWWYQTNLKATHQYQSRPWQWFLDVRPVWMYVSYEGDTIANIYAQGNPILFWVGDIAIIVSILMLLKQVVKKETATSSTWSQTFLLISYFAVWAFWQFSPRIMFFYHYTPAVPLLAINLSYWLVKGQNATEEIKIGKYSFRVGRVVLFLFLSLLVATFFVFYPNWTGIAVPAQFAQNIYYLLPTWR